MLHWIWVTQFSFKTLRILLVLFLGLFCVETSFGQQFSTAIDVQLSVLSPKNVNLSDLDSDGDMRIWETEFLEHRGDFRHCLLLRLD